MNIRRLAFAVLAVTAALATSSVPAALASVPVPTDGVSVSAPTGDVSVNALPVSVTCPWGETFRMTDYPSSGWNGPLYTWSGDYLGATAGQETCAGTGVVSYMSWQDSGVVTSSGVYGTFCDFGTPVSHQLSGVAHLNLDIDGEYDLVTVSYTAAGDGYLQISGSGTSQLHPNRTVSLTGAGTMSLPADQCGSFFSVLGAVKITYS